MNTVELGTTTEMISQFGLGCMGLGTLTDDPTSFALLDRYAADGGNFLDTADCYSWWWARGTPGGQSEEVIGRWLARSGRRDQTFVATKGTGRIRDLTKVWTDDGEQADWSKARSQFVGAGAQTLRTSLEGSLRRLGVEYIDLYYVHVDDRSTPLEESLEALAGFVREGKVRYLGWSNVRTWRLERIRGLCAANGWPQPVALQQQHSYLQRRAGLQDVSIVDDEQLDYLRERPDLSLIAYSPLLQGVYDAAPAERDGYGKMSAYIGEAATRRLAAVDDVAKQVGAEPGQVVLAWLIAQRSPQVVPLIGTTQVSRYQAAVAAQDLKLTEEQLAQLDAA
ncbi:MAG TPA: aldo/keto reductase [Kineosporiaceae bacterium]|nr:aldo/keto reductase [Kineosporiaceae bacterium]